MSADSNDSDGPNGRPKFKLKAKPRAQVLPRALTLAGEVQRREKKATVGEVEDGLRNLMRLVKTQLAGRDALIQAQDAVIETLVNTIQELEVAVREINPGWAGLSGVILPDGTDPGAAVETAPSGGGYALEPATPPEGSAERAELELNRPTELPPVSDPAVTPTEDLTP